MHFALSSFATVATLVVTVSSAAQLISRTPSGWTYVGCYTEATVGRALSSDGYADDNVTQESCASYCNPYALSGVEYGRECYCGNALNAGSNSAAESDCSYQCGGDSTGTEKCGAGNRLNVFSHPIPTSTSSVTPYPTGAFTAYGCWKDNYPINNGVRALKDDRTSSNSMSVEYCSQYCAPYTWFGVEYGSECYCGSVVNASSSAVAGNQCTFPCAGAPSEMCGGNYLMNLYQNLPYTSSTGTATATTTLASSSSASPVQPTSTSSSATLGLPTSTSSSASLVQPTSTSSLIAPVQPTSTSSSASLVQPTSTSSSATLVPPTSISSSATTVQLTSTSSSATPVSTLSFTTSSRTSTSSIFPPTSSSSSSSTSPASVPTSKSNTSNSMTPVLSSTSTTLASSPSPTPSSFKTTPFPSSTLTTSTTSTSAVATACTPPLLDAYFQETNLALVPWAAVTTSNSIAYDFQNKNPDNRNPPQSCCQHASVILSSGTTTNAWFNQPITVCPYKTYLFSGWSRRSYAFDSGCNLQWFIATPDGKTVLSVLATQSDYDTNQWVRSTGSWASGSYTRVTFNVRTVCTGSPRAGRIFNFDSFDFYAS